MTSPCTLDDLATGWLTRRITQWDANPGLNNTLGSIQIEADPVAFKHPVFPPYSAGSEVTGFTLLNRRNVATTATNVAMRWRAFEVERRATTADAWELTSRTTLLPDQPGVVVELTVRNAGTQTRALELALILSGRGRNKGLEGYNWSVPEIATGTASFHGTEGLAYTITPAGIPDAICIGSDQEQAFSVQAVWPAPQTWREKRIPSWTTEVAIGDTFTVCLLCTYAAERAEAEALAAQWRGRTAEAFAAARIRWEERWAAAFTPGNAIFSGSVPVCPSASEPLRRLYYQGVLTLLTIYRTYPQALINPAYITLWPRRGEGSVYLSWELPYTSGMLARLDPKALREMILLAMSAPEMEGQLTNYFNGKHWGWGCCAYPQAIITASLNLLRAQPDQSWLDTPVQRRAIGKAVTGQPDSQPVNDEEAAKFRTLTARQALIESITMHRRRHLPNSPLVNYGSRAAYHECITTYAHGTAGHTAIQAWALQAGAEILGEDTTAERARLIAAICDLYRPGDGYFDCLHPDGSRYAADNLYDVGLVLNHIGEALPPTMVAEIEAFVRRELVTPTWAHCLSPTSTNVVDGIRADHSWSGCFPAWPPQFILGLQRAGHQASWVQDWVARMSGITSQGPYGQGYWADDSYPPELGAAAKGFDGLDGTLHWVIGSGAYFAQFVLDWQPKAGE